MKKKTAIRITLTLLLCVIGSLILFEMCRGSYAAYRSRIKGAISFLDAVLEHCAASGQNLLSSHEGKSWRETLAEYYREQELGADAPPWSDDVTPPLFSETPPLSICMQNRSTLSLLPGNTFFHAAVLDETNPATDRSQYLLVHLPSAQVHWKSPQILSAQELQRLLSECKDKASVYAIHDRKLFNHEELSALLLQHQQDRR